MYYIADLHVHSRYAYATSKYLTLETLYQWAQVKGIDVIGTGDCIHPQWLATIRSDLEPLSNGFFRLKRLPDSSLFPGISFKYQPVYFCLSTEVSCVYRHLGKVRKGHYLIYFPDISTATQLYERLSQVGNLGADGRPVLGISARDLLEIVLGISPRCHVIPAHVWTPWFAVFGANSGYDSLEDCFQDLTPYIFALETGLSSDPRMNWKISDLDRYTLVSNSDAHSPQNVGREATCFDTELGYDPLFEAIKTRNGFRGTLEFFPEEGKYHLDGHRECGVCFTPLQTRQHRGICPVCGKPLTVGVLNRVEQLADRSDSEQPKDAPDFSYIVPLREIIATIEGKGVKTKHVNKLYQRAIKLFKNEFTGLLFTPLQDIKKHLGVLYMEAIEAIRTRQVKRICGYDGKYGSIQFPSLSASPIQATMLSI